MLEELEVLRRFLLRGLPIAMTLMITSACSSSVEVDGFGPSAGFAVVEGGVSTADGGPLANRGVFMNMCELPVTGVPTDTTDASGQFRLEQRLIPIGALLPELRERLESNGSITGVCTVGVEEGQVSKRINITFYRIQDDVVPVSVNFELAGG